MLWCSKQDDDETKTWSIKGMVKGLKKQQFSEADMM